MLKTKQSSYTKLQFEFDLKFHTFSIQINNFYKQYSSLHSKLFPYVVKITISLHNNRHFPSKQEPLNAKKTLTKFSVLFFILPFFKMYNQPHWPVSNNAFNWNVLAHIYTLIFTQISFLYDTCSSNLFINRDTCIHFLQYIFNNMIWI